MSFNSVGPTSTEISATLPGDEIVPAANVVMDRAFTRATRSHQIWPWFEQLGKGRSGWYLPRSVERFIPRVHLRLRLGGVKHERLAQVVGGAFDWWTIAGLAAGLRQRLRSP